MFSSMSHDLLVSRLVALRFSSSRKSVYGLRRTTVFLLALVLDDGFSSTPGAATRRTVDVGLDVPTSNEKRLVVSSKDFINSIERVASVSLDRKEGVKLVINKDNVQLSVNSANSGEGNEKIKAQFSSENLNISFNSKYLIDIASEVEDKNLKMNLKDSASPVLIEDTSDKNSYYVIMPMKI